MSEPENEPTTEAVSPVEEAPAPETAEEAAAAAEEEDEGEGGPGDQG